LRDALMALWQSAQPKAWSRSATCGGGMGKNVRGGKAGGTHYKEKRENSGGVVDLPDEKETRCQIGKTKLHVDWELRWEKS